LFGSIPATLTDRTVTDADVFTAIAALPPSEPEPAPVRAVKTESYRRPGVAYAATAQAAPAAPRADADRCRQLAVVLLVVIFISAAGGVIGAAFVSRR
jgi:hypothetical protein